MTNVWIISDTHFHHEGILTFTNWEGKPMRPGFNDAKEMNEYIVARWNETVKPKDKVYHLGDVSMRHTAEHMKILGRLNGNKTLILGNHDSKRIGFYTPYFGGIYSSRGIAGLLLTHVPVHPESIGKCIGNVHGHVHSNVPQGHFGPRYYNVSIEMLDDYRPISLDVVADRLRDRISQNEKLSHGAHPALESIRDNDTFILHPRC